MVLGIGILVVGIVLVYSALNNVSVAEALQGITNKDADFLPGFSANAGVPGVGTEISGEGFQLLLQLANLARTQYSLTVREFGPDCGKSYSQYGYSDPVDCGEHVSGTLHRGRAFDASGSGKNMSAFANAIKGNTKIAELFWCGDRPVNLTYGQPTSCGGGFGGHTDHVHVGV